MNTTTPTTRRTWPWIIGTAAAVGVLIVAAIVYFGTQDGTAAPTSSPSPPTSSSTPQTTPTATDVLPTGCLGGENRDAAMVLSAQQKALRSPSGAVEVATAFVRWLNQYPYPSGADAEKVATTALAAAAPTKDLRAFFAAEPNLSGGLVPDTTEYYLSTVPGVWHVESAANDEVVATIGTGLVVGGVLSPTLKGSITVTVRWEDGEWKFLKSVGTRSTQDLYSIGQAFTSGC